MKIGIVGLGVVGTAIEHGFKKLGHKVLVHDIKFDTEISSLKSTEVIYICVPTPQSENGQCNITIVDQVLSDLSKMKYAGFVCIKSTVAPGTTQKMIDRYKNLDISFVPEFLRERCAEVDFVENHDICIIGTNSEEAYGTIKKTHGTYPQKFIRLDPTEAELSKYFNNVYNATLITFANSFYEVCKSLGADYTEIKNAVSSRKNISNIYLDCNENVRGFGGACLPKDTSALAYLAKNAGLQVEFFDDILKENKKYKTTVFRGMRK